MVAPTLPRPRIAFLLPLAALVAVLATPHQASAQRPDIGPDTQLRSTKFEFVDGQSFSDEQLQKQLAQQPQGGHVKLRDTFDFLPFVEPVVPCPFDPVELQRDVVRLRRFYARSGFPNSDVRYRVASDPKSDVVKVVFVIQEGKPVLLTDLQIVGPDSLTSGAWPPDLQSSWKRLVSDLDKNRGERIGADEKRAIESAVLEWIRNHGYPYAKVEAALQEDLATHTAALRVRFDPGPRARVTAVEVEGNDKVKADVVRKTLPFEPGDWYSARQMTEGQRSLLNLDLFRVVQADLPPQPQDSTVAVRVRVEEGKSRLVTGEAGYLSDAGLTLRGEWAHRNFYGGARTMTVSLIGQTGIWAIDEDPERLLHGSVTLKQPGVLLRSVSLLTSPYAQYRDDYRDKSAELGWNTSLVYYDPGWLRTASVQYTLSARHVIEYRTGSGGSIDIFTLLESALDSLGTRSTRSSFTFAATLGKQDHPVKPRKLLLLRPSFEITTPGSWNTAEFGRLDVTLQNAAPISQRISFWGRVSAGHLYPFGKSIPNGDDLDGLQRYLELRDYVFTAGGTGDVRGWASRLLGPKTPDLQVSTGPDSTLHADRYVPVGGLSRLAGSLELRLPFPGLAAPWGTLAFLDGGRVWSGEQRYIGDDLYDQERFFYATGFGIDRDTPVGPIRVALAYILNPSPLDVLKPQEFLDELALNGLTTVHTHWNRRLHFHLSIGAGF